MICYDLGVSVAERIEKKLREALDPSHVEVINESHMHNVPRGSETHFKVVVVSARFDGITAVKRHQLVYGTLADELKGGVHALAITSRTPTEWAATPEANASPKCLGGNGK
jgi:BolA protein